jgi:uncharacterized protein YPO0396
VTLKALKLAIASMSIVWFAPATAQSRLDPGPSNETATVQQELQTKIDEQQKILRDLHDQIDQQAKVVESAREIAIGTGAVGDAASVFIDEYVREQKTLDELKKELAPNITRAEQALAALQAQQTSLSAQVKPKSLPVRSAKDRTVPSPVPKKPAGTAVGASLQAKQ